MTLTLRPEHEKLISDALRSGAYRNPEEVIGRALELLNSEDEWLQEQKDFLAAKIERAFDQFDKGDFLSAEQSRRDMEKRKAEWLASRHDF